MSHNNNCSNKILRLYDFLDKLRINTLNIKVEIMLETSCW